MQIWISKERSDLETDLEDSSLQVKTWSEDMGVKERG